MNTTLSLLGLLHRIPWRWQSCLFGTEFSFLHPSSVGDGSVAGKDYPLEGGVYYRVEVTQPPILEPGVRYRVRELLPIRQRVG